MNENANKRTYFTPVVGEVYKNRNGWEYRCLETGWPLRDHETIMQSTQLRSGFSERCLLGHVDGIQLQPHITIPNSFHNGYLHKYCFVKQKALLATSLQDATALSPTY